MLRASLAVADERGWGWWCVDINGECAGFTGLSAPTYQTPFTPCVEVGWRFRPQFWGQGYATEAARLALDYGFGTLQLPEIVSFAAAGNQRSPRVMERIAMHDHPNIAAGHRLRRHVLYRKRRQH